MKRLLFTSIILSLFCQGNVHAQTISDTRQSVFNTEYDAYIKQAMEKFPEIPGIAVVVIKDDKPVFLKTYGMADKEANVKADLQTLFYIASSTKSFTAMAAALLDKEGIIKLDDPVIKYCKGVSFKNPIPEKITVRDLLTHTSGLQNDPLTFRMAYTGQVAPADMVRVFANATFAVDSNYGKYQYDNLGYNIYAMLLQQTLGKKWQDILQEKIFSPLQLGHTTAYISKATKNKWTVAYPYMYTPENVVVRSWLAKTDDNMQSAGGMFASITDIGSWLNMNMNKGVLNGKQVIPADVIQKCHTGYTKTVRDQAPFTGNGEYGLGWQIGQYKQEKVIYHHGGFPGYRSHISFMPDKKIAVAVLVNEGSIGGRASHLLATYAYEWWLEISGMQESYASQLQELADSYEKNKKSMQAAAADRAKRTSQLSLSLENYTGQYVHPDYGTLEVSIKDNSLAVKMGAMYAVSTPFTQKESIRVELEPGSGTSVRFKKNEQEKIKSLSYSGIDFVKTK